MFHKVFLIFNRFDLIWYQNTSSLLFLHLVPPSSHWVFPGPSLFTIQIAEKICRSFIQTCSENIWGCNITWHCNAMHISLNALDPHAIWLKRKALQCKLAVGDVTYIPRWERRCRVCNSCIWPWLLMYSMLHCYHPVSTHSSALATSYFTLQCTGYIITSHHSTGYIIKSDHSTGYIIL